jgi:Family of unknown function (DUF6151)
MRGVAREVSSSSGFRFICYCKDCQAFARLLKQLDVLDAAGGTDIFQMPAGRVTLTAGVDALRCVRLRDGTKVLRWYANCCRTPIGNTAVNPRFPVVALIHSVIDDEACGRPRNELLGPPLCRIYQRSAVAPLPRNAPRPPSPRLFALRAQRIFGWWLRGLGRPNPFFDENTNAPLSVPRVLTPSERAAV